MTKKALFYAEHMLENSFLWTHAELPYSAHLTPGLPEVLVVAGDNCSGKSLFAEVLRAMTSGNGRQTICVSIRERTGSGLSEMAGMRRAMMFGNESDQSTGAISSRTVDTAFSTLDDRAANGISALLVLDEPELGLSAGYAGALGEHLGGLAKGMPALACGLVVVTHSKDLARRLLKKLDAVPSFVHMGRPLTYREWLAEEPHFSVEDLAALKTHNSAGRRAVCDILAEGEAAARADEANRQLAE